MGVILKVLAVVLVVGGIYIWITGRSVTKADSLVVATSTLAASPIFAPTVAASTFSEEGTIILDTSNGLPAKPYILYTTYTENGSPSIVTKRLVFLRQDECAERNLPCATNQPSMPVSADEKVHITGYLKDDTVEVTELRKL